MSGKINRPPVGGTEPLDPGRARSAPLKGAGAEEAPQGRAAEPAPKPVAKDRLSAAKQVPSDAGQAVKGELDRLLKKRPKDEPTPAEKPEIVAGTPLCGNPVGSPNLSKPSREGGHHLTLRHHEGGQPHLERPGIKPRCRPESDQPIPDRKPVHEDFLRKRED